MKVSKKELWLLLAILGIGIAVCAWQFGFKKINEKVDALRTETEALQKDIAQYTAVKDNIGVYQKGIEDANKKIADVLEVFPAAILAEDDIMLGREFEKNDKNVYVSSVSIEDSATVFTAASQPVEPTTAPVAYVLNKQKNSYTFTVDYDGFKDMVDYTFNHKNRMSIDEFALSYDGDTGLLAGTMNVNMYYVTGADKQYTPQNLSSVLVGSDNIFGTVDGE